MINAYTFAGAEAVGAGVGAGIAASGSGAASQNSITTTTEAKISGGSVTTKTGAFVHVYATDTSTIKAQAGADAVAAGVGFGGGGGIAVGAAITDNGISNTTRALISGANVTSGSGVEVHASSSAKIYSNAIGIAAALGGGVFVGIAVSGAGSFSDNVITNTIEAGITGGSTVSSSAGQPISVRAEDTSDIASFTGAVAVAVGAAIFSAGVAIGVSVSANDVGNTVRARIDDSKVTSAAALTVEAHSTGNIRSHALAATFAGGTLGGFGVGAAVTENTIHSTTEARIVDADAASAQEAKGTTVKVEATDDSTIVSNTIGFAGSIGIAAASIGFVKSDNTITSGTTAKISNSKVTSTVGEVEVLASSTGSITSNPTAAAIAGGIVSAAGGGVLAKNTVTPVTTATIMSGSAVIAATHVKVEAKDTSTVDSTIVAIAGSGGLGAVAVGLASAENTINGSVTGSTVASNVTASNGDIDVLASANETVTTFSVVLSVAYGAIAAAGAGSKVDEKILTNVTASVSGGTLTAAGHDVNVHASFTGDSNPKATSVSGSIGFGGSFSGVDTSTRIGGATEASASGGTIVANKLDLDAND